MPFLPPPPRAGFAAGDPGRVVPNSKPGGERRASWGELPGGGRFAGIVRRGRGGALSCGCNPRSIAPEADQEPRCRGRLSGWISAVSGLAALGVGLALGALQGEGSSGLFAGLLVGGAVLWFAAAAVFGRIVELPGATEGGANGVVEVFARLTLLRDDRPLSPRS